jgi:hypothetical protein
MNTLIGGVVLAVFLQSATGRAEDVANTSTCPDQHRALNLAKWKRKVQSARSGFELSRALKALSFLRDVSGHPLDSESIDFLETRFGAESIKVDDFKVQLSPGAQPDHVIQVIARGATFVDFDSKQKVFPWFRLAKVLRPMGPDEWCDLGMIISEPDNIPDLCDPYPGTTFSFEQLIDANSKAIRTLCDFTLCNPGGKDESQSRTVAYWAVVQGNIQKIFEQALSMNSSNVFSGQREVSATVTLSGSFPKLIEVRSTEDCNPGMAAGNFCVPEGEPGPNGPGTFERSKRTFTFDGKRYVQQSAKRSRKSDE